MSDIKIVGRRKYLTADQKIAIVKETPVSRFHATPAVIQHVMPKRVSYRDV
jgi:hypothetical protein